MEDLETCHGYSIRFHSRERGTDKGLVISGIVKECRSNKISKNALLIFENRDGKRYMTSSDGKGRYKLIINEDYFDGDISVRGRGNINIEDIFIPSVYTCRLDFYLMSYGEVFVNDIYLDKQSIIDIYKLRDSL